VEDYVNKFTAYLKRVRPLSTGLSSMAAELDAAKPQQQQQKKKDSNKDGNKAKPQCLCGLRHSLVDCWLINTKHPQRPKAFFDAIGQENLDTTLAADAELRDNITKSLENWRTKHRQGNGSIVIDEQNGLAGRAGSLLVIRARAMRIQAGLPKSLSNELLRTAAYILNRTPTEALQWKIPCEIVWKTKPKVQHMHPIGCRAYVLNRSLKRADKLEPRALIRHLDGYDSTNIFRIWLPTKDEVIRTRDVVFEPTKFYDGRRLPQGFLDCYED
jgi:hypothetical protein